MEDERKTKKQLIDELTRLRQRLSQESRHLAEAPCRADGLETRNQDNMIRQRMEQLIRASVEQWYTIFNTMSDAICLLDSQGRIQRCNQAMVNLLDRPLGEILDHHFWQVVFDMPEPIDECPVGRMWKSLSRESKVVLLGDRWFDFSVDPLLASDGQSIGAVCVMTDVTERKRAEEALRESELAYRELADSITDVFFAMDHDLRYTYWNKASESLTGIRAEDALGKSILEVFPDTPWTRRAEKMYREMLRTQQPQTFVNEANLKGRCYVFEISAYPSRSGTSVFVKDITERKRAEEALRESEENFKSLAENASDGIVIASGEGAHVYANKQLAELTGYSVAELLKATIKDLAHPEEFNKIMERYRGRLEGKPVLRQYETVIIRKDGKSVPIELAATKTAWQGQPADLVFMRDISVRKQVEEERERLLEQVRAGEEQLRDLTQYLQAAREEERAYIAREIHDEFGQALTALKMDLAWLSRRLPSGKPDLAQKIQAMSGLLDTTIQTVRHVAAELRPGLLDDLGLSAALEWQAQEFAKRTGIACDLRLGEESAPLGRDLDTAIFRIFQEALTNVARHAEATRVSVEVEDGPDEWVLVVQDDGKGIADSQVADPASLGLAGMRERARAWGGDVTFQGIPGRGTTVTVRVPRVKAQEVQP